MSKVAVIFNSPPKSGKDACCNYLSERYGWNHLEFKEQLFIATCERFGVSLEWFMDGYNDNKEEPQEALDGFSKRQALIDTSENKIKPKLGKAHFGQMLASSLKEGVNVVSDGGFREEFGPVYEATDGKMIIVQCSRPGTTFDGDSRNYVNHYKGAIYLNMRNSMDLDYIFKIVDERLKDVIDNRGSEIKLIDETKRAIKLKNNVYSLKEGKTTIDLRDDEYIRLKDNCCPYLRDIRYATSLDDVIMLLKLAENNGYHLLGSRGKIYSSDKLAEYVKTIKDRTIYNPQQLFKNLTRNYGLRATVRALFYYEFGEEL